MSENITSPRMIAEIICDTNTTIYREMTKEEIAAQDAIRIESEKIEAEKKAITEAREILKTSAKAKLIAGEPLTAEEADLFII